MLCKLMYEMRLSNKNYIELIEISLISRGKMLNIIDRIDCLYHLGFLGLESANTADLINYTLSEVIMINNYIDDKF